MKEFRIGQGLDIHPFETEGTKPFVLGGVEIKNTPGLVGHSDADALIHAICDAMLGALALGDIGHYFPDTDPAFKGRSSIFFLEKIATLLSEKGWSISNIDSTVLTESPMLKNHIPLMKEKLCSLLQIKPDQLSIKATRPEKLGSLGRKEGLLVMANILLFR